MRIVRTSGKSVPTVARELDLTETCLRSWVQQAKVDAILEDVLETEHGVKNALDRFLERLGVTAVQGLLQHRMHYVVVEGRLAIHLESAYDAFRAHCKRIDYQGEVVDLKTLRRLAAENHKQAGFVVAESERICFGGREDRRRALLVDLARTQVVSADDFPDPDRGRLSSLFSPRREIDGWMGNRHHPENL